MNKINSKSQAHNINKTVSRQDSKFKSVLVTLVIVCSLFLSIPSFLTVIGLFLAPLATLNQVFVYPFLIGLMVWPSLVASTDISFIIFGGLQPLLLVVTLLLVFKSKLKKVSKIVLFLFLIMSLLGYYIQFLSGARFSFDDRPAFVMKSGVKYTTIPRSTNLERLRKNFLSSTELGKGPYDYKLLGWKDSETLVYARGTSNYTYNLVSQSPILTSNSMDNLYKNVCVLKECLQNKVEYAGLINNWTAPVFVSPDGNKFAVVSEYMYGTQDIIVIYK